MSTINEAIDTAIKSIKDIDLNTVTADRTVNNQISDIGKIFGKAIKDYRCSRLWEPTKHLSNLRRYNTPPVLMKRNEVFTKP